MAQHTVRTTHIQEMLQEALELSKQVDNVFNAETITTDRYQTGEAEVEHTLCRIQNLCEHAAAEINDERLRCFGWM